MKNKIILSILLALYFLVCGMAYTQDQKYYLDIDAYYDLKAVVKSNGYNYTNLYNLRLLEAIDDFSNTEEYGKTKDIQNINLFQHFGIYNKNLVYYVTNIEDLEKLIEKENLTNDDNINLKNVKFNLPIGDKSYSKVFRDYFTADKKQAKVIGTDKNGYSKFDISPDALILATFKGEILGYGYIDNRLIDTRDIMNRKYEREYEYKYDSYKQIVIKQNDKGNYNKFKLEEVEIEYEKKQTDYND